jgi:predicted phage-related endonuclease
MNNKEVIIGGSIIGAIAGVSKWQTPLETWEILTGRRQVPVTWQMRRGTVLQDAILNWWIDQNLGTYKILQTNVHIVGEPSYIVGDLDGVVLDKKGEKYVVEIKSSLYAEEPLEEWICQVTWYEGLSGIHKGFILIENGREIKEFPCGFDQELFDLLRNTAIEFYEKYIVTDMPPPPTTPSEKLKVAVSKIVPTLSSEFVSQDLVKVGEEWLAIEKMLKKKQEEMEEIKSKIADFMAEKGVLKVVAPTWEVTLVEREGNISWKSVAMELGAKNRPDLLEKYRGRPTRYITIKSRL